MKKQSKIAVNRKETNKDVNGKKLGGTSPQESQLQTDEEELGTVEEGKEQQERKVSSKMKQDD